MRPVSVTFVLAEFVYACHNTADRALYLQYLTLSFISGGHLDHALEWYVHHLRFCMC